MSGNMWKGDWAERLSSRVNSLGFDGVDGFVHAFPGETYAQLARRLGSDVAPVQVVRLQLGEVKKKGRLRETARDVLAREIASYLPAGWGSGTDFQTAGAFAAWSATLIVHADAPELQAVTRRVWLALKEQSPPNGWTPQDGDDGVIVKAFDVGWPVS